MAAQPPVTLEEFLSLDETKPYSEFANGGVYQKTGGDWSHSAVQTFLMVALFGFQQRTQLGEALPELLYYAARSPFYQARLGSSVTQLRGRADLESVPPTTKQDLRDAYPLGFLAVPKEELASYHESSGTAGRPMFPGRRSGRQPSAAAKKASALRTSRVARVTWASGTAPPRRILL